MEELKQAAGDAEAKLDREIQLRSKTDGEVEEALAAFEQSKAVIDRAITRKAEQLQEQAARRHAELVPSEKIAKKRLKRYSAWRKRQRGLIVN